MRYKMLRAIVWFLFRLLSRPDVRGLEQVPPTGAFLFATNHIGMLEVPLIYVLVARDDLSALVADKHRKNPLLRLLVNLVNGIWINRESADIRALKETLAYLQEGGAVGIAPEGTRSSTHALIPAKTGVAYLADKAGVPIVPVGVSESEARKVFSAWLRLRRPVIRVRFGAPFVLPPVNRRQREQDLQRNTDEIMCRIAILLPEAYRGVYAGHPRLQELLAEEQAAIPSLEDAHQPSMENR
jgi:1-acyl-sn-glycerol-3-phosphate acyltransferase